MSKRSMSSTAVTRSPLARQSQTGRQPAEHSTGIAAALGELLQRHGPVAFRQPSAVGSHHEWHVGVARRGQPEQLAEVDLARRRGQQIVAPHDFGDALRGIVDHHGEVVRGHAVVAAQHDVIDRGGARTGHRILERDLVAIGEEAQRGAAPVGSLRRACGGGQPAACSRIAPIGGRTRGVR